MKCKIEGKSKNYMLPKTNTEWLILSHRSYGWLLGFLHPCVLHGWCSSDRWRMYSFPVAVYQEKRARARPLGYPWSKWRIGRSTWLEEICCLHDWGKGHVICETHLRTYWEALFHINTTWLSPDAFLWSLSSLEPLISLDLSFDPLRRVHCYYCFYIILSANPVRRSEEPRVDVNLGFNPDFKQSSLWKCFFILKFPLIIVSIKPRYLAYIRFKSITEWLLSKVFFRFAL